PSFSYDPNTTKLCTWWIDLSSEYSCQALVTDNFITLEQFRHWNPSITSNCEGLVVGKSYCVEAYDDPPPPTSSTTSISSTSVTSSTAKPTTPSTMITPSSTIQTPSPTTLAPTTTKPTNGIETPFPLQPSIVANCDAFYFVKMDESCDSIAAANGISTAQFITWNPSAGSNCAGLWAEAYACVSIIGHTPTSAVPTTTKPGNGIATPSPIQTGMVDNCDSFYKVVDGDSCAKIAIAKGITSAQIISWNPALGSNCGSLWLDTYICISTIGHTPTTPTPTQPGNGVSTPTPYQTGMTNSCKSFHFVIDGDNCERISSQYRISLNDFVKWNPAVGGTGCGSLWRNTYACVAVL
ncbi:carbohydrate-binding module family 50 protein, partial [Periconia macrospinosa]